LWSGAGGPGPVVPRSGRVRVPPVAGGGGCVTGLAEHQHRRVCGDAMAGWPFPRRSQSWLHHACQRCALQTGPFSVISHSICLCLVYWSWVVCAVMQQLCRQPAAGYCNSSLHNLHRPSQWQPALSSAGQLSLVGCTGIHPSAPQHAVAELWPTHAFRLAAAEPAVLDQWRSRRVQLDGRLAWLPGGHPALAAPHCLCPQLALRRTEAGRARSQASFPTVAQVRAPVWTGGMRSWGMP
jgi:hypothetical protein